MKHVSLILALTMGLCPALHAAEKKHLNDAAKSPYPSHVVQFYEVVKDCYYELKKRGYDQNQISSAVVTTMDQWQNPELLEAFKLGMMTGDKAAALYRQTADYAALKGDSELSLWLNSLVGVELVRNHQSAPLGIATLLAFVGVPVMVVFALIVNIIQGAETRRFRRLNYDLRWQRDRLKREFYGYN